MKQKKCFKCGIEKEITSFYTHPQMADGHLNKCKECTKKDSEARRIEKEKDPMWVFLERKRHRVKSRKYRAEGRSCPIRNRKISKEKKRATVLVHQEIQKGNIEKKPCEVCGNESAQAHHEDYSKPLDVVWLCVRHHNDRHIHIRNSEVLGEKQMAIKEWLKNPIEDPISLARENK